MGVRLSSAMCLALVNGMGVSGGISNGMRDRLNFSSAHLGVLRVALKPGERITVLLNEAILSSNPLDFELATWLSEAKDFELNLQITSS